MCNLLNKYSNLIWRVEVKTHLCKSWGFFSVEFMTQKRRRAETLDRDHALYRNVFLYPPRDPDPVQIWCVLFLPMLHTLTTCLENGTSSFSVSNRQTTKTNLPKTRLPGDFRTNKPETDHYLYLYLSDQYFSFHLLWINSQTVKPSIHSNTL